MDDALDPTVAETWALRILDLTGSPVAVTVATGRLFIGAKAALPPVEYARLFERRLVPLKASSAYRFMAIARNPVLSEPAYAAQLPPKWTVLSVLADLPTALLLAALRDGRVTPQTDTPAAHALRRAFRANLNPATLALPPAGIRGTRVDRIARLNKIRELAADGASSDQIAAHVGLRVETCRLLMRTQGIDCVADRVRGRAPKLNADRILDDMVASAAGIATDIELLNFSSLSPDALPAYIESLQASVRSIIKLIGTLSQQQKELRHVSAEKK